MPFSTDPTTGPLVGTFSRTSLLGWRTPEAFAGKVRLYLRDFIENNRLIKDEETSDIMLDMHRELAIEDFNTTPHTTNFSLSNFPSMYLLLIGTVIQVLRSSGISQSRNRLNYNDGGISVAVSDKAGEYQSWIASMLNEYERKKRELKISINITSGFGHVPSEYMFSNLVFF
jgi:hypothetical protein